jgi:fructose-1,6-bisphosphatase/inositol monophosphatase family enzyme
MTVAEMNSLEREALRAFRDGDDARPRSGEEDATWAAFGLRCLLEAGRVLRESAGSPGALVDLKSDGSPATPLERAVEEAIRDRLSVFEPSAVFLGEETGGPDLPRSGLAVAVDPVDGTWAFLTQSATWTSTLAVFRDGRAVAGFVGCPMTGELAYAVAGKRTRCLRVSTFGEPDAGFDLPSPSREKDKLLVNFHPSVGTEAVQGALHEAWASGDLSMVRAPGGSPAWGLLEAARGHYVYLNAWSKRRAEPFDLAAGVLLVRGAGGEVTDLDGEPIDSALHAGPWVAGLDAGQRDQVAAIFRSAKLAE